MKAVVALLLAALAAAADLDPLCACVADDAAPACAAAVNDTCAAAPAASACVHCRPDATTAACTAAVGNATDDGNACVDWPAWCACAADDSCGALVNATCAAPGKPPPQLALTCQVCPTAPDSELCAVLLRDMLADGFYAGACALERLSSPAPYAPECPTSLSSVAYEELQLGRAFESYQAGDTEVPLEFREHRAVVGDLVGQVPWDCTAFELQGTARTLNYAFFAYIVPVSALFFWRHPRQPIRARSVTVSAAHVTWLALAHVLISVRYSAGLTTPCVLVMLQSFVGTPLITLTYCWRSMQLAFLYHWCQNSDDPKKRSWYRHRRRLVRNASYFATMGAGILVGSGFIALMWLTSSELGSLSESTYATMRCDWWQIPEEYQGVVAGDEQWCHCIAGNATQCDDALLQTCTLGQLSEVIDMCTACIADNATAPAAASGACAELTGAFMSGLVEDGSCGRAAETPSFHGCASCLGHNGGLVLAASYNCVLLFVALCFCLRIRHLDDQVWIRGELLLFQSVALPAMAVTQALYIDDKFSRTLSADVVAQPHFWIIVTLMWASFTLSITVPLLLSFRLRLRRRLRRAAGLCLQLLPERLGLADTRDRMLIMGRVSASVRDSELEAAASAQFASISHGLRARSVPSVSASVDALGDAWADGDEDEPGPSLAYVINSPEALALYREFAKREFTIENIEFLMAVRELVFTESASEARAQALVLWETFVSPEADLEVNLPAGMRAALAEALDGDPDRLDALSRQDICEMFVDACVEIELLVQRDSYERFKDSRFYDEVQLMFRRDRTFEKAVVRSGVVPVGH